MIKLSKKNTVPLLKRLLVVVRFILLLPISISITDVVTDFFKDKYQEFNSDLFRYKVFEDLLPGITIPNEAELMPFYIIAGAINGILWITVGTIIAPKKKFLVSCTLLFFSIVFLLSVVDGTKLDDLFSYLFSILTVFLLHPKKVLKILKSKFSQSVILGLVFISILIFGLFFYNKNKTRLMWMTNKKMSLEADIKDDRISLDMNGDGKYEMFTNPTMTSDEDRYDSNPFLILKDDDGNVLATTPEWFGEAPKAISMDWVASPQSSGLSDIVQVNMYLGYLDTHSFFLRLEDNLLKPICKVEETTLMSDCLFYNSGGSSVEAEGGLYGGLGDDNELAIIEFVEEHPKIRAGKTVAWGIYIYNGSFFEQQFGEKYDEYFEDVQDQYDRWRDSSEFIKKSDMDRSSIHYLNEKLNPTSTSKTICDVVVEKEEGKNIVEIYDGEPAKVDFATMPEARLYYTVITSAVAEGPNFAGHYTIASWGCGTDCAGYAIVDSITGDIEYYSPSTEKTDLGNSFSYSLTSPIFVSRPREYYLRRFGDLTLEEVVEQEDDGWYTTEIRKYFVFDEDSPSLRLLCQENVLSGAVNQDDVPHRIGTYLAKLKRISTSGEARFYWYDISLEEIEDIDDQYSWFFAMPKEVPDDYPLTEKWVKFIKENEDSVFRITGSKRKDDCGYYGPDHCVEDIDLETIEVVGEDKKMEF